MLELFRHWYFMFVILWWNTVFHVQQNVQITYTTQSSDKHNSEYIIIFLNKLKIVENINNNKMEKNQNKTYMVKAMGPVRDSRPPFWLCGPRTNIPAEPPSHRACQLHNYSNSYCFHMTSFLSHREMFLMLNFDL